MQFHQWCLIKKIHNDEFFIAQATSIFIKGHGIRQLPWNSVNSCQCIHSHLFVSGLKELSSVNYLELYRVADLFHLPTLEEAVVGFLVEHLSELSQSRQDEALQLPYRLLREVLRSDRLTSLSEEEIWEVLVSVVTSFLCKRLGRRLSKL